MPVDTAAATDRLMRLLAVEGVTGQEAAIGRTIAAELKDAGVPASAIYLDDANTRIPVPTETGNLIVHLPGQGKLHNQPRIMFMTHMDTVPLCAGAKPDAQGPQDRQHREDRARRRQPHRLRRAGHARGRAREAEARPSAAHAAVLRARGKRALRRALRQQGRPRRPGDGVQLRRRLGLQRRGRRGRRGPLGGRDLRPRLACGRRA